MLQAHEPALLDLAVIGLHGAIRRLAARILQTPEALEVAQFRRVEQLMRLAIALAGSGRGLPLVEFHGLPPYPGAGPGALPEILSIPLTDLLAARASDFLSEALEGDVEALHALEQEAERLLETEDIQIA